MLLNALFIGISFIITILMLLNLFKSRKSYFDHYKQKETTNQDSQQLAKAPSIEIYNTDGDLVKLLEDNSSIKVIVFINEFCIHCGNHLETFLNATKELNLLVKANVIMDKKSKVYAEELLALYGDEIKLLFCDDKALEALNISFFPAFIILDKKNNVLSRTPVPHSALTLLQELRQKKVLV